MLMLNHLCFVYVAVLVTGYWFRFWLWFVTAICCETRKETTKAIVIAIIVIITITITTHHYASLVGVHHLLTYLALIYLKIGHKLLAIFLLPPSE